MLKKHLQPAKSFLSSRQETRLLSLTKLSRVQGSKERIQLYRGVVIKIAGHGDKKRFTVRKMSGTVGVERIFPIESPNIESIEINKIGKVRRAKLYYLRKLTGKAARIKEKRRPVTVE